MKRSMVLGLALLSQTAIADTNAYVTISGLSHHFKDLPENFPQKDWNEVNRGVGFQVDRDWKEGWKIGLTGGVYEDSFYTVAKYFGGMVYKHMYTNKQGWYFDAGVAGVVLSSPSYYSNLPGDLIPAPIPFIGFGYDTDGVQLMYLPEARNLPDDCNKGNLKCASSDAVVLIFKFKVY